MSKELLPELPDSGRAVEYIWDLEVTPVHVAEAYGQACYEAGRKSVDLEQFRPMVTFFRMAGVEAVELETTSIDKMGNGLRAISESDRLLAIIDAHKPTNGR